jgi:predicted ester cyclase
MAGGTVRGRRAIEDVYRAMFRAFPDVGFAAEALLIDGDRLAQSLMMTGTDTGGFLGLPPTGKAFRLPIVILCTLTNGCIVHERRIYDFTGMLIQIGVLKAKPA